MSGDPTPPDPETLQPSPDAADPTDAAESGSSGLGDHPVVEGLLSTEPSEAADTPPELAIRGTKKFIRGALGARVKSGQTAIEDYIHASIGFMRQRDDGSEAATHPQQQQEESRQADHWEPQGDDSEPFDDA